MTWTPDAKAKKVDLNSLTKRRSPPGIRASLLLSGKLLTGRDAAHKRIHDPEQKKPLPVDFTNRVIYYVGPVDPVRDEVVGPAGPTTATRMDKFTDLMLSKTGLAAMIGKGERGRPRSRRSAGTRRPRSSRSAARRIWWRRRSASRAWSRSRTSAWKRSTSSRCRTCRSPSRSIRPVNPSTSPGRRSGRRKSLTQDSRHGCLSNWPAIWAIFAGGLVAGAYITKVAPALPGLRDELGLTLVESGFIATTFNVMGMLVGMLAGVLCDRFGTSGSRLQGSACSSLEASSAPAPGASGASFSGASSKASASSFHGLRRGADDVGRDAARPRQSARTVERLHADRRCDSALRRALADRRWGWRGLPGWCSPLRPSSRRWL